ncbi:hypothetical protein Anapl_04187 [Anas platyrhynchos]|uniref:Uncharacterized protein n=1 Tax=Anas platyrhynchos TaxID=8839 RepID=R0JP44_ANAPL|nr:hypothetical protein Anapl_04187 [Anas platyrhynchos]
MQAKQQAWSKQRLTADCNAVIRPCDRRDVQHHSTNKEKIWHAERYVDLCEPFGKLGVKFVFVVKLKSREYLHLQSQFGEMFSSTCRSKELVVSGNQAPACPFTLENFPHKF